ncbi:lysis protein [Brochothrix thermosphacta]|uniref:Lysis protein n=2 Tax=Brochothrix thermosphacta TaxID=2756 RepID=A0A291BYU3_BROTH|nr:lysis protein [Brochothrix thermosphacta]ATH85683.1 lysis protein [Brochothrix thermosphacta]MPQ28727.1 lysis protein [Brochothrix thermosphacta]
MIHSKETTMTKKQTAIILFIMAAILSMTYFLNKADNKNTSAPANESQLKKENASADTSQKNDFPPKVTLVEAIESYQQEHPDTDISSIELEQSFNKWFYTIEGLDDEKEYELRVDAHSQKTSKKQVKKLDRDEKNGIKRNESKIDTSKLVALTEIGKVATENAAGEITELSLEKELSHTYWTVKVEEGLNETEVKIDAFSKDVLEIEQDD